MRPGVIAPIVSLGLILFASRPAAAHAFLRRYDLPLPLWHYLWGAALTVALTFVLVAIFSTAAAGRFSRGIDLSGTAVERVIHNRAVRRMLGLIASLCFFLVVVAGLFGAQEDPFKNILPAFIWVGWWVGFAFICALIGNAWPAVNPWALVGRGVARIVPRHARRQLPAAAGVWPAVLFYFGFAWAELVWPDNAVPDRLAAAILVYSALTWLAMTVYGTESWLRCGEVFSLLFALFGRFAPLGRDAGGRLVLRPYGAGLLVSRPVSISMTVLVLCLLATVSFDGFLHTPPWRNFFGSAFTVAYDLGLIDLLGNTGARTVIVTAGLIGATLIFIAVFIGVCGCTSAMMARARTGQYRAVELARLYVLTLVPIAIAYHLAHYLSLLLIEGQRLIALVSDPFGWGWNLFGTAGLVPDITIVDARFLWWFAVLSVVAGHMIAVWLAHVTALRICEDRRQALGSQLPMVGLMIGYTMLSLWILAQPIVET